MARDEYSAKTRSQNTMEKYKKVENMHELLGIGEGTLRRWNDDGEIPSYRIWVWERADRRFKPSEVYQALGIDYPSKLDEMEAKEWLMTGEAARFLDIHPNIIRKLNNRSILNAYRHDRGKRKFRRKDVEAMLVKTEEFNDLKRYLLEMKNI